MLSSTLDTKSESNNLNISTSKTATHNDIEKHDTPLSSSSSSSPPSSRSSSASSASPTTKPGTPPDHSPDAPQATSSSSPALQKSISVEEDEEFKVLVSTHQDDDEPRDGLTTPSETKEAHEHTTSGHKQSATSEDSLTNRQPEPPRATELRFLVRRREAGALIGKRGSNIKRLRETFKGSSFSIPDTGNGPERVVCVLATCETGHKAADESTLDLILNELTALFLEKSPQYDDQIELKLLIHSSHAGSIIGISGQSIKKLRNDSKAAIKIYEMCCPFSSERVCAIKAKPPVVVNTIKLIQAILNDNPIKGPVSPYDATNFDLSLVDKYGGYLPDDCLPVDLIQHQPAYVPVHHPGQQHHHHHNQLFANCSLSGPIEDRQVSAPPDGLEHHQAKYHNSVWRRPQVVNNKRPSQQPPGGRHYSPTSGQTSNLAEAPPARTQRFHPYSNRNSFAVQPNHHHDHHHYQQHLNHHLTYKSFGGSHFPAAVTGCQQWRPQSGQSSIAQQQQVAAAAAAAAAAASANLRCHQPGRPSCACLFLPAMAGHQHHLDLIGQRPLQANPTARAGTTSMGGGGGVDPLQMIRRNS